MLTVTIDPSIHRQAVPNRIAIQFQPSAYLRYRDSSFMQRPNLFQGNIALGSGYRLPG